MEDRILDTEKRVQLMENFVGNLLQLQSKLQAQITDQEGRSRRNNIRIYNVAENKEKSAQTVIDFLENPLREKLKLPPTVGLYIERATYWTAGDLLPNPFPSKTECFTQTEQCFNNTS